MTQRDGSGLEQLALALFGADVPDGDFWERRYPPRALPAGAAVTRCSPSPTGYLHIGGLFGALADKLAAGKDGVFYLRVEDTDKKREVEGGTRAITQGLRAFDLLPDEGVTELGETGAYGPYTQSRRKPVYHSFARQLALAGLAYPCFCTAEELDGLRSRQLEQNVNTGYYGPWAKCRDLPLEEQLARITAGERYTLRLRSPGGAARKFVFTDRIRGKLELPENDMDIVLLKADGMPTYHFAHAVDDHLMRTTIVIRGDEWLASLPVHVQLFRALGFAPPQYAHTATLMKLDPETGGKRKISKRKDPEAAVSYFAEQGIPAAAVKEYLLTILNSNFEDWRRQNPAPPLEDFPFSLKKCGAGGALFDLQKLADVSKTVISRFTAKEVCEQALAWAREYDPELAVWLGRDPAWAAAMFGIDRGGAKPRKDLACWGELRETYAYFFDELYRPLPCVQPGAAEILRAYLDIYDPEDDKDVWFAKLQGICAPLGYCANVKVYKADPGAYKGHVGDVSGAVRWAAASRANTPDLWAVMRVLGGERVRARLEAALAAL